MSENDFSKTFSNADEDPGREGDESNEYADDGAHEIPYCSGTPASSFQMDVKPVVNRNSLDEDVTMLDQRMDIIRDLNMPNVYIKKIQFQTATKTGRVFNTYHFCAYCNKKVSNFATHIFNRHMNVKTTQAIKLERNSEERKRRIGLLRFEFNHMNNMKVLREKQGELLLDRRPTGNILDARHYGPCPYCLVWTSLNGLYRHQSTCKAKPDLTMSQSALLTQSLTISERNFNEYLLSQESFGGD